MSCCSLCRRDRSWRDWDRGRGRDGGREWDGGRGSDWGRERGRGRWSDEGRERGGGRGEQRERSPQVWKHDMFEALQKEEEQGGTEGGEGWEEEEEDIGSGRQRKYVHTASKLMYGHVYVAAIYTIIPPPPPPTSERMVGDTLTPFILCVCRSVVHRLGTRDENEDHRASRDCRGGIEGVWVHDKFAKHDQLVSYPIPHQMKADRRGRRGRRGEGEGEGGGGTDEETSEVAMDTI